MTREEAITVLKDSFYHHLCDEDEKKAVDMAISALQWQDEFVIGADIGKTEPYTDIKPITDDRPKGLYHGTLDVQSGVVTVTEPSDLISRDKLLSKLKRRKKFFIDAWGSFHLLSITDKSRVDELDACIAEVTNAPSVSAERVGEWIFDTGIPIGKGRESAGYRCSKCRKDYFCVDNFNYCPNCGARMESTK